MVTLFMSDLLLVLVIVFKSTCFVLTLSCLGDWFVCGGGGGGGLGEWFALVGCGEVPVGEKIFIEFACC